MIWTMARASIEREYQPVWQRVAAHHFVSERANVVRQGEQLLARLLEGFEVLLT